MQLCLMERLTSKDYQCFETGKLRKERTLRLGKKLRVGAKHSGRKSRLSAINCDPNASPLLSRHSPAIIAEIIAC